jgi:hypothetical protein
MAPCFVQLFYRGQFNLASGRNNFTSILDANYFKQQVEEIHVTEKARFAHDKQKIGMVRSDEQRNAELLKWTERLKTIFCRT